MTSSVHISPDIFSTSCSRSIKDNEYSHNKSDINNIEKSSSILQNQNAAESRHKSRDETDDLADHPKYKLFN